MAQGGGSQASQQPGNSLLQHMNFRGHEAEAVNQEQPEHILGKTIEFYLLSTYLNPVTLARVISNQMVF